MKVLALRRAGVCCRCSASLERGVEAAGDSATRTVCCLDPGCVMTAPVHRAGASRHVLFTTGRGLGSSDASGSLPCMTTSPRDQPRDARRQLGQCGAEHALHVVAAEPGR